MPLNISDISYASPKPGTKYLIDSNVWFFLLLSPPEIKPSEKKYLDFVRKIQTSNLVPPATIILNSVQLSEIINLCLRRYYFKNFLKYNRITNDESSTYKQLYRNSDQYKIDVKILCDDILAHRKYIEFINDEFSNLDPIQLIKTFSQDQLDFNDLYYAKIAKNKSFTIITNDGDFVIQDVQVLTSNRNLLDRRLS